jgi:hypothetical protein
MRPVLVIAVLWTVALGTEPHDLGIRETLAVCESKSGVTIAGVVTGDACQIPVLSGQPLMEDLE